MTRALAVAGPFDHPTGAGTHQAEGQGDHPQRQSEIDYAGAQTKDIGVMLGIEYGYQGDEQFCGYQQLCQAPAAPILGHIAEHPDSTKPDDN